MDEYHIAKLAIIGNEQAQIELLKFYEPSMYRVAYSYLHNHHDSEEAVAEMAFQFLKSIHTVRSPEYIRTWLVRIVINTSLQIKRKQKRVMISTEQSEPFYTPASFLEMNEMIQQLTIEEQQLIHLKYFADLKTVDIAKLQNIPEGTVKSRIHHTLKRLKKIIVEGEQQ